MEGDSFAERMRKRALERLERNAHLIQSDEDIDCPSLSKKLKSPDPIVERENKENVTDSTTAFVSTVTKPIIAEEEQPAEKREDVYVKHCKNRLANLAGQYKKFEDEVTPHPTPVKQTIKRRSAERKLTESCASPRKNNQNVRFGSPQKSIGYQSPRKRNGDGKLFSKTPEKAVLAESVIQSSASQGFKKIDDDRPFIQNSRKEDLNNGAEPDPCLLSVAERRKLFEKRMRGEIEDKPINQPSPVNHILDEKVPETRDVSIPSLHGDENEDLDEYYSSSEYNNGGNSGKRSHTPTNDDVNYEREDEENTEKESDSSQHPKLESVKKVKFMSTPKPGRLYANISDHDENKNEADMTMGTSMCDTTYKSPNPDDSFGQEVLCATNSIFSSFQNSRKETSNIEKSKGDLLDEVRDLITPGDETSLSLSPMARSSLASVECPNETASFTYLKPFANNTTDESPRQYSCKKTIRFQPNLGNEEENEVETEENDEVNVTEKIRYLEELIVKEKIFLSQEIRALKYCLSTSFVYSISHLEAEKLVLLSQLRIEEAQNEIQRIKVEKSVQPYSSSNNSVRGNVVISKIKLPIKMSVVHSSLKDDIENNLICIVKCGEVVLATEVMPVVQSRIKQDVDCTYIEFPDTITVPDVTSDFKIRVEVYNLVVDKKDTSGVKNKDKEKKNLNASKKSKKAKLLLTSYNHEDKKNPQSSFQMIGYMIFSQNLAQRHQWMLNKHHLPLLGMIMMELKCNLAKITIQKHGFLTMYEIISGYGAWSRYWFYLNGDKLSYWKYPEQESVQDPVGTLDLKKCISKDVVVVGYDIVFRPQTFILKFDPPTYLKQFKNLTEDRLLLSADTEEDRISWCDCLNEVLKSVRSWSSPNESSK